MGFREFMTPMKLILLNYKAKFFAHLIDVSNF